MTSLIAGIGEAFVFGILTPLGAVCVLPLYPGFLAYLVDQVSGEEKPHRRIFTLFGLVITGGVILFMSILCIIFTTVLRVSLTTVIGIASPIAFVILIVISILLILNVDLSRLFPKIHSPLRRSPWLSAFLYGLLFGAIVIPCNPLFIAALFTRTVTIAGFAENMARFVAFGFGISLPLLIIAIISTAQSDRMISFLTNYQKTINRVVGGVMLGLSLYYLFFVFRVLERL